jgi:hypothetical protein
MFVVGAALLIYEMSSEMSLLLSGGRRVTTWSEIMRAAVSLGDPLMFNGVVLYVAGRLMSMWKVSIVGLAKDGGARLLVRGPDASNTVWIGKKYRSAAAAEIGAGSLRERLQIKE